MTRNNTREKMDEEQFEELMQEAASASRINRVSGFLPLKGTQAQIAYAEIIRRKALEQAEIKNLDQHKIDKIKNIDRSSFWIEHKRNWTKNL